MEGDVALSDEYPEKARQALEAERDAALARAERADAAANELAERLERAEARLKLLEAKLAEDACMFIRLENEARAATQAKVAAVARVEKAEARVRELEAFERLIRASYLPDGEADILMSQAAVEAEARHWEGCESRHINCAKADAAEARVRELEALLREVDPHMKGGDMIGNIPADWLPRVAALLEEKP